MWSWSLCDKVGQQKQLHLSGFSSIGNMPPVFANQAVQRETQQQVEQNWICAAPGACLLWLSGPYLVADICVVPSTTAYLMSETPYSVWMQILCYWTSASEPLMRPANKKECNFLSLSLAWIFSCATNLQAHTHTQVYGNEWQPWLPAVLERGFRVKQDVAAFRTGLGLLFWWA